MAKKRKLTVRQEKFVEGVLKHGNGARAAREAGYSPKRARVTAHELTVTNRNIQERIKARQAEAQVQTNEVVGTLASQMRADLADILPDDEILRGARERGVSHLIKKLKVRRRLIPVKDGEPIEEVTHELEVYSAQEAAKQLCMTLGLNKKEAENPLDAAREAFSVLSREFTDVPRGLIAERVGKRFGVEPSELISEAVN